MLKKRRIKKTIWRKLNTVNLSITAMSIFVSFMIVSVGNSFQISQNQQSSQNNLQYSALRLADAFELYNEKRFAEE